MFVILFVTLLSSHCGLKEVARYGSSLPWEIRKVGGLPPAAGRGGNGRGIWRKDWLTAQIFARVAFMQNICGVLPRSRGPLSGSPVRCRAITPEAVNLSETFRFPRHSETLISCLIFAPSGRCRRGGSLPVSSFRHMSAHPDAGGRSAQSVSSSPSN